MVLILAIESPKTLGLSFFLVFGFGTKDMLGVEKEMKKIPYSHPNQRDI